MRSRIGARVATVLALAAMVVATLAVSLGDDAQAQTRTPVMQRGAMVKPSRPATTRDPLTVWIVTFGPGDHPFFKFGHNAIWIQDRRTPNRDYIYNFGTFRFDSPTLIPEFVLGRFQYWLSRSASMYSTLRAYTRENRTVDVQELNLTPKQKLDLAAALEENLLPQNKHYKYDYYRDNCSTRVRDAIDKVLDGKLKEQSMEPGRLTYRQHTRRLTADSPLFTTVLDLVMGDLIDQPTTQWDEQFLPGEVQKKLREASVVKPSGEQEPLVLSEHRLFKANRPDELTEPPSWGIYFLLAGVVSGGAMALLGKEGRTKKGLRVLQGALLSLLGLVFGFLGTFYLFAWFFTDHAVGYHNENSLHHAPWLLLMVGVGIGVARGKPRSLRRGFRLVAAAAALSLLGVLFKVLPWFDQGNWHLILFFLPLWLGAAYGLYLQAKPYLEPAALEAAERRKREEEADKKKPADDDDDAGDDQDEDDSDEDDSDEDDSDKDDSDKDDSDKDDRS